MDTMNSTSDQNEISAFEAAKALTQLVSFREHQRTHGSVVSDDDSSSCAAPASSSARSTTKASKKPSSTSKKPEIFPLRLHRMLSDPSVSSHVIAWLPHGRSFVILRPDVFAVSVLPAHFPESSMGKTRYPSFTRKLNRWGLKQIGKGPDAGAFQHELFRRDEPEVCTGMRCQKSGGRGSKSSGKRRQHAAGPVEEESRVAVSPAPQQPSPPRSVPLKKRKLSHQPAPTKTVTVADHSSVSALSLASFSDGAASTSASSSIASLSETPPVHSGTPSRTSSFTETAAPTQNQQWQLQGQQGHEHGSVESTLQQLQASMEKAKAQADCGAIRIQPRPVTEIAPSPACGTAEAHKAMLYKAFLQAMNQ